MRVKELLRIINQQHVYGVSESGSGKPLKVEDSFERDIWLIDPVMINNSPYIHIVVWRE